MGKMNWLRGQIVEHSGVRRLSVGGYAMPLPLSENSMCGEATIGVRPELLRVTVDGWLPAQVTGRSYLGDCIVLHVQLADGTKLIVDQRAPFCDAAPGSEVRLAWPSEATHVFPVGNGEGPN
jgi:ABC-type Fe3+/spermidine/putrescine transport system ATPase subunit